MGLKYFLVCSLTILLLSINLNASHIVGGYFNYRFIDTVNADSVRYEVEFRMYRDCINGNPNAQLEDVVPITVFNSNNSTVLMRSDPK